MYFKNFLIENYFFFFFYVPGNVLWYIASDMHVFVFVFVFLFYFNFLALKMALCRKRVY